MSTKPPFLDVGTVAALLRWHPNTLRDHLVPLTEWTRGSSSVPSTRLGRRHYIPRWWVEETIAAGTVAPGTENTE